MKTWTFISLRLMHYSVVFSFTPTEQFSLINHPVLLVQLYVWRNIFYLWQTTSFYLKYLKRTYMLKLILCQYAFVWIFLHIFFSKNAIRFSKFQIEVCVTRDDALYFQNKIICSEIELVYNVIQLYKCVILRIKIQKIKQFCYDDT